MSKTQEDFERDHEGVVRYGEDARGVVSASKYSKYQARRAIADDNGGDIDDVVVYRKYVNWEAVPESDLEYFRDEGIIEPDETHGWFLSERGRNGFKVWAEEI